MAYQKGDTVRYKRQLKFSKGSIGIEAKVVAINGNKMLLDNGDELLND